MSGMFVAATEEKRINSIELRDGGQGPGIEK